MTVQPAVHKICRTISGLVALMTLVFCMGLGADDVGIDKARLIEESPGVYLLEVDTVPRIATAYRVPILPARCEMTGPPERERIGGGLSIRFRFRSTGQPLGPDDTLLLPWNRLGSLITAQWHDGSITVRLTCVMKTTFMTGWRSA